MPLTWTPDPATVPWHDVQADEIWTAGPITAFDATAVDTDADANADSDADDAETELTVTGYDCEIIGAEPLAGLRIQTSASGVMVSAPNALTRAFPSVDIEYQIQRVTGHCATFDDLPNEADEIIRYLPNPANTKDSTLRVTAHCADTLTGAVQHHSADFILRVWANYDPGRDALKEAIHARRR